MVGRLMNDLSFKIIDAYGNRCGIHDTGELYIRGRHKFLGYYKNPKLTQEALDGEGFFKTGDIGRIDEDGRLFILDKKKNVISQIGGFSHLKLKKFY